MSLTIKAHTNLNYDVSTIKSVNEQLKATTALEAKAGHIVFQDPSTGIWTAYALSASLAGYKASVSDGTINAPYVGVLLEDANLSTSPKKAKIAIAGIVYKDFIRDAGITESNCPDTLLRTFSGIQTQILFLDAVKGVN